MLAEEGWLLGQRHLFIMTIPLPWPNNLHTFTKTYLSSGSLTSLCVAHGPISLSRPFIPTIAPRNSTFSLLREKYIFLTCRRLFTCNEHAPDASAFRTPQHLLHFIRHPVPTFYGVIKILRWGFFIGIRARTLPLTFPSYINCLKNPDAPLFEFSTLKNQFKVLIPIFL